MTDLDKLAMSLTEAEKTCLIDLFDQGRPWLLGQRNWQDYNARHRFYQMGLLLPVFPEAKQGNSGRQFWLFNETGTALRNHLKGQNDG